MANDRLEVVSKFVAMLSDLAKLIAISSLAAFALASLAAPGWANKRLDLLGLKISEINAFGVKVIAKEVARAGGDVIKIADQLTNVEISLAALTASLPNSLASSDHVNSEITRAIDGVKAARDVLDQQAQALKKSGEKVGLEQQVPGTGWIFVGSFNERNEPRFLSPRIASGGIKLKDGRIDAIMLKHEAHIVSDGGSCTRTAIEDAPLPDVRATERVFAILKPSESVPLEVLEVSECPSIGSGKTVYAMIKVPKDRIRFSQLSNIQNVLHD